MQLSGTKPPSTTTSQASPTRFTPLKSKAGNVSLIRTMNSCVNSLDTVAVSATRPAAWVLAHLAEVAQNPHSRPKSDFHHCLISIAELVLKISTAANAIGAFERAEYSHSAVRSLELQHAQGQPSPGWMTTECSSRAVARESAQVTLETSFSWHRAGVTKTISSVSSTEGSHRKMSAPVTPTRRDDPCTNPNRVHHRRKGITSQRIAAAHPPKTITSTNTATLHRYDHTAHPYGSRGDDGEQVALVPGVSAILSTPDQSNVGINSTHDQGQQRFKRKLHLSTQPGRKPTRSASAARQEHADRPDSTVSSSIVLETDVPGALVACGPQECVTRWARRIAEAAYVWRCFSRRFRYVAGRACSRVDAGSIASFGLLTGILCVLCVAFSLERSLRSLNPMAGRGTVVELSMRHRYVTYPIDNMRHDDTTYHTAAYVHSNLWLMLCAVVFGG